MGVRSACAQTLRRAGASLLRRLPAPDAQVFVERPYELHLEFTNLCNATCVFCPYPIQERAHEFMTDEVFHKAVDEFVAIGGGSVSLTPTVGDPLIHPKCFEWIRYLRSIPQIDRISITTNAIRLKQLGVKEFLDAGLSVIHISLAGFDEDMYRRIYRSKSYRNVRDAIYELYEENARRSEPVPVFLCLRPDCSEEELMLQEDFQRVLRYQPNLEVCTSFSRSGGMVQELPEGMKLEPVATARKSVACENTYRGVLVQSGGDVQVCACEAAINAPALVIGNIEQQTLLEIWGGERLRALRESFSDGTLNPNCAQCDYYYAPFAPGTWEERQRARISRRRQRGEIVRHSKPVDRVWQFD